MHRQSVSPNAFKPCMILSIPEPLTAKQYQSLETRSNLSRVVTPGVKGGFQACFLARCGATTPPTQQRSRDGPAACPDV